MSLHGNNLDALAAMDSGSSDPLQHFRFCDIFKIRVLHPFLVILVLMFVLQFCGQGVITFYTVQIFKVRMWIQIGSDENYYPGRLQYCQVSSSIIQDACSIVEYYPVLSRTLAVLSRQRTALLSLESLTSSQLCSGVYDHNGSDDTNHYVIDMSQAQPEDDTALICDLSPSPASS